MITSGMSGIQDDGDSALSMQDSSRRDELQQRIDTMLRTFDGDIDMLEKALGMLMLGDHVGWRVLVLVHSKSTLRRYEQILGIKIREFFPEEGPLSMHSPGYIRALELRSFWKVANGDIPVEHRRSLRPPSGRDALQGGASDQHEDHHDPGSLKH